MVALTVPVFIGLLFAIIAGGVLILFGAVNIRTGRKTLARARITGDEAVWHKQLAFLFGLNNIAFGLLVILIGFYSVIADRTIKYVFIGLIALALLVSLLLVGRCVVVALQTANRLQSKKREQ